MFIYAAFLVFEAASSQIFGTHLARFCTVFVHLGSIGIALSEICPQGATRVQVLAFAVGRSLNIHTRCRTEFFHVLSIAQTFAFLLPG
jgi:hypothetical protein